MQLDNHLKIICEWPKTADETHEFELLGHRGDIVCKGSHSEFFKKYGLLNLGLILVFLI